jgi:hypothetical protein
MEQLTNFADDRLVTNCIYCGAIDDSRDHVPSRVFLDAPFPSNLPVVQACRACNNGLSQDEEYVACLLECVVAGSTNPADMRRPVAAAILRRSPALRARIEAAKTTTNEQVQFSVEEDRVKRVLLKLARGHAAFELARVCRDEPRWLWWQPLELLSDEARAPFEEAHVIGMFGEVGSRSLQRAMVVQPVIEASDGTKTLLGAGLLINDWIEIQENRYRYLAVDDAEGVVIRIVIGGYLACEASWDE